MASTSRPRSRFRRLLDGGAHLLVLLAVAVVIFFLRVAALFSLPFHRHPGTADILQWAFRRGLAGMWLFFDLTRLVRITCNGDPVGEPAVLVANHPSLIDALVLIPHLPKTACLYKAHLERAIFPRSLAENTGFISNAGGMESIRAAVERLQKGWRVLAFPEGTRTAVPPMGPWKSSYALMAARAGVPIQPVYIEVDSPIFAKNAPWWRPAHFPVHIGVRFGATVPPPTEQSVRQFHRQMEASFREEMVGNPKHERPAQTDFVGPGLPSLTFPYSPDPMTKPHPVLSPHYQDEKEKQTFLRKIFDEAAPHYEGIVKWGWFGSGHRYRKEALRRAGLAEGMRVLDVAAGTGPTARAIKEVVGSENLVTCLEPSAGMIAESKKLLACEHIQAGAEAMPVEDASYDFVTMGFALRHVDDLEKAFSEFHRVLRPTGKALILDVTVPKSRIGRCVMKAYFKHILPSLTRVFTRSKPASYLMSYYWETMETMTPPETVIKALEKAGFRTVTHRLNLGVFSEYEAIR